MRGRRAPLRVAAGRVRDVRGVALARGYARAVVALRWPIILAWLAALVAALRPAARPRRVGERPAERHRARRREGGRWRRSSSLQLFGSTIATDTVAVERNPRGLPRASVEAQLQRGGRGGRGRPGVRAAAPLLDMPVPACTGTSAARRWSRTCSSQPTSTSTSAHRLARDYLATLPAPAPGTRAGHHRRRPRPAARSGTRSTAALPWMEAATVLTILLIVAAVLPLGRRAARDAGDRRRSGTSSRSARWRGAASRPATACPTRSSPCSSSCCSGSSPTTRSSSWPRRAGACGAAPPASEAAAPATARVAPLVFAAGMLVVAGALSLLAGQLHFFRVFGPGLAVAARVVTLVCVTLVPALMAVARPVAVRRAGARQGRAAGGRAGAARESTGRRPLPRAALRRAGCRRPGRSPRWSWSPARGLLVVAALGARSISLSVSLHPVAAVPQRAAPDGRGGRAGVRARHPRADRARARAPGDRASGPTRSRGCRSCYAREPGVAAVLGPAQTGRDAPVGRRHLA